jgi:hypothetical protein
MFGVVCLKSLFMHFDVCLRLRSPPLPKHARDYYILAGSLGSQKVTSKMEESRTTCLELVSRKCSQELSCSPAAEVSTMLQEAHMKNNMGFTIRLFPNVYINLLSTPYFSPASPHLLHYSLKPD